MMTFVMYVGMGKVNFKKLQQAIKRKRLDEVPEAKKKKSGEASTLTSFVRTPTMESSRSSNLVEALEPISSPLMTGLSRSSKTVYLVSPISPIISSGIA